MQKGTYLCVGLDTDMSRIPKHLLGKKDPILEFNKQIINAMGVDSVKPFLEFENKWVILLALTSNKGSKDFQFTLQEKEQPLYEKVMRRAQEWGTAENLMFVTGATQSAHIEKIREIAPDNFLLVPGVGAQGGSLHGVSMTGLNGQGGLLVNSSRGIIYAGDGEDFAVKAREAAMKIKKEMGALLDQRYVAGN